METQVDILNPAHNKNLIRSALSNQSHYVIKDFFNIDFAEQIFQCLSHDVPWQIAFRMDDSNQVLEREQLNQLGAEKRAQLMQQILEKAKSEYQFLYNRYPMVDSLIAGKNPDLFLNKVVEFLNSPSYLDFLKQITGDQQIRKCSAQATWYAPGNFLQYHTDVSQEDEDRRFAYVLGFTKDWKADWGGLLQFLDEDDNQVTETITPAFNTLAIFKVPQGHSVSYVAPFATKPRFSITGWLRAD